MGITQQQGSVIGSVIGTIIGAVSGGLFGAFQGFVIGASVGRAFGDVNLPDGPKVDNEQGVQSRYGASIPRTYGIDVVPTNIIFLKENRLIPKTRKETTKNKMFGITTSKTTQKFTDYYAHFAVRVCEGEVKRFVAIYLNDILVWTEESGVVHSSLLKKTKLSRKKILKLLKQQDQLENIIRMYRGTYQQDVDPMFIDSDHTYSPAYRGEAIIVFDGLMVSNQIFGNRIPEVKVIVEKIQTDEPTYDDTTRSIFVDNLSLTDSTGAVTQKYLHLDFENNLPWFRYAADGSSGNPFHVSNAAVIGLHAIDDSYAYLSYCIATVNSAYYKTVTYGYTNNSNIARTFYSNAAYPVYRQLRALGALGIDGTTPELATNFEHQLWLYPFDFPSKESFANYEAPFFTTGSATENKLWMRPILNSPDMYLVLTGKAGISGRVDVSIAKAVGDRFSVYTIDGLVLDEGNNLFGVGASGTTTPDSWTTAVHTVAGGALAPFALNAVLLWGKVYIFCQYYELRDIAFNTIWFPGLIIVTVDGLTWHTVEFEQRDKITTWSTGTYYDDSSNYTIDISRLGKVNKQFITDWVWNKSYQYDCLCPDYENGTLYGSLIRQATTRYQNASIVLVSTINAQSSNGIYKINPDTGDLITDYGAAPADWVTNGSNAAVVLLRGTTSGSARIGFAHSALTRVIDGRYVLMPWGVWDFTTGDYAYSGWAQNTLANSTANDFAGVLYTTVNLGSQYNIFPINKEEDFADHITAGMFNYYQTGTKQQQDSWLRKWRFYFSTRRTSLESAETVTLENLLLGEFKRTGILTASDLNFSALSSDIVSGFTIADRGDLGTICSALQSAYLFDLVEKDYKIVAVKREGGAIRRTIAYTDLEAGEVGEIVQDFKPTVPASYKIPSSWMLNYRDASLNYETGTVQIDNPAATDNTVSTIDIPLVFTQQQAIQILDRIVRVTKSLEQGTTEISLTMQHSDLDPADLITLGLSDGTSWNLRIIDINKGSPGLVKITAQIDDANNYTSARTITNVTTTTTTESPINIYPVVIDSLPFIGEEDQPGYWIGSVDLGGDSKSIIQVSYDGESTWQAFDTASGDTAVGYCTNAMTSVRLQGVLDYTESLTIRPLGNSVFTTVTEAVLLADEKTNTYFYGNGNRWEIIKILTWTDNADGTYTGTGILSGYKGTFHFAGVHEIGDLLIGIDDNLVKLNATLGAFISLRFGSYFLPEDDSIVIGRYVGGFGRLPLPPINVTATRDSSGNITFAWVKQSRYSIEWVEGSDTALDEDIEQYNIYILNAGSNNVVVRTITVANATTGSYTSAQQVTDWGSNQSSVKIAIAEYSNTLATVGIPYVGTL